MGNCGSKAIVLNLGKTKKIEVITPLGRHIQFNQSTLETSDMDEDEEDTTNSDQLLCDRVLTAAGIDSGLAPGFLWTTKQRNGQRDSITFCCFPIHKWFSTEPLLPTFLDLQCSPSELIRIDNARTCPAALVEAFCLASNYESPIGKGLNSNQGWVPLAFEEVFEVSSKMIELGFAKPGVTKILDLGSGTGSAAIIWASFGLSVVGIEYNSDLFRFSEQISELCKSKLPSSASMKFVNGSYYPCEFISDHEKGESWSSRQEQPHAREHIFFHFVATPDSTDQIKSELASADVIYAFLWCVQVPSIMELFSKYCKQDAALLIVNTTPSLLPNDLRVVASFDSGGSTIQRRLDSRFHFMETPGYPCKVYKKV